MAELFAHTKTLALRDKDNVLIEAVSGSFELSDVERLQKFSNFMSRIRSCRLLVRGMPAISNISIKPESGLKLTCASYEDSELHELLHVLRPVMLQDEYASFHKITGLLSKRFNSRRFSNFLKPIRSMFSDGELKSYMQITLGDQDFFDFSLLDTWLNAEQYHADETKTARWSEFAKTLTSENTRALVMNQLQSRVKALFLIDDLVGLTLEGYKTSVS